MRVALMQTAPGHVVAANFERLSAACAESARAEVDILVTPEMFLTGYNIGPDACLDAAQLIGGQLIQDVAALAHTHGIAVVVGFAELGSGDSVYNALALIDSEGNLTSSYRKTHLYGAIDRTQFTAGDAFAEPVCVAGTSVGLAICYDIEFPETVRTLALNGAEVVLVPTANWLETVNQRLVPARAQENGVFMVYANYVGQEGTLHYCGQSVVAAPDGSIVSMGTNEPQLLIVDVNLAALAAERSEINYLKDRRPELYS